MGFIPSFQRSSANRPIMFERSVSELALARSTVEELHRAFEDEILQMGEFFILDDSGQPIRFYEMNDPIADTPSPGHRYSRGGRQMNLTMGLRINLGNRVRKQQIELVVHSPQDGRPMEVRLIERLRHERGGVSVVGRYSLDTNVDDMLRDLFTLLVPEMYLQVQRRRAGR